MGNFIRMRRQTAVYLQTAVLSCFLVFSVFLAGCDEPLVPEAISLATETAPAQPTPTLAAGMPAVPVAADDVSSAAPTRTPLPTLTPIPTAPPPPEHIQAGADPLAEGNFALAADRLQTQLQSAELDAVAQRQALFDLGVAYFADGRYAAAAETFSQLLADPAAPAEAHFYLGRALAAQDDLDAAVDAYRAYLDANPDTAAYVAPILGDAYLALGDRESGIAAYETAVSVPANRFTEVANRLKLAEFYLADGRIDDAIAQYDAVRAVAQTEFTRGQANYLAGMAELNRGNSEAAYERFQTGISQYPRAYESYLSLVQLVEAGQPVDDYQRGLVNYHAKSYEPCVAAFDRYLAASSENARADAHLYSAYCYEGVGNLDASLAQLDRYAAAVPARAQIERADLLARAGDGDRAVAAYRDYLDAFSGGADAAYAAWRVAVLLHNAGDTAAAVDAYAQFAAGYPTDERAAEALFRGGWLANQGNDVETAVTLWRQAVQEYAERPFGAAAMVWLLHTLPTHVTPTVAVTATAAATATVTTTAASPFDLLALRQEIETLALASPALDYYHLRAKDIVNDERPFSSTSSFTPPDAAALAAAQVEAEAWLRGWLELPAGTDVATLSPALAADERLIVGRKLWRIGLLESAKRELESLRADVSGEALASYQLALFFRDLGLYRSSILAAASVQTLSGQTLFDAPRFIGMLQYPAYYADLILPLAEQYGYDPRLQFALVRQESLFESFARSGAAAQGLSQVIPDTGVYIAQRLGWPNFVNEDLYKPYVGLNFGAYYLAEQLRVFNGDVHAALAAYNAGPGNAARWHRQAGSDLDLFLEVINFPETRLYVERIYVGYVLYSYLYGE